MARVRGPLMSADARGVLGPLLLFRGGKKAAHAYLPGDPNKLNQRPPTPAQQARRTIYAEALAAWQALDPGAKDTWTAKAKARPDAVSGWNLYFQDYARRPAPARPRTPWLAVGRPILLCRFGLADLDSSAPVTIDLAMTP